MTKQITYNPHNGMAANMFGLPFPVIEVFQNSLDERELAAARAMYAQLFSPPPAFNQEMGEFEYVIDEQSFEIFLAGFYFQLIKEHDRLTPRDEERIKPYLKKQAKPIPEENLTHIAASEDRLIKRFALPKVSRRDEPQDQKYTTAPQLAQINEQVFEKQIDLIDQQKHNPEAVRTTGYLQRVEDVPKDQQQDNMFDHLAWFVPIDKIDKNLSTAGEQGILIVSAMVSELEISIQISFSQQPFSHALLFGASDAKILGGASLEMSKFRHFLDSETGELDITPLKRLVKDRNWSAVKKIVHNTVKSTLV